MNILILSAMEEEINYLVTSYDLTAIDTINNNSLYCLNAGEQKIYILNSSIGKVNSAITTSMVLNKYQIDKLISIGTSGALTAKTEIGDFVNGERLAYHDVDVTAFGYEVGQLPQMNKYFETTKDQFWDNLMSEFSAQQEINLHTGDIVTGDQFINSVERKQFINKNFENGLCAEMESTAIIHTALSYGVDCYALRSISDNADGHADVSFDEYLSKVCQNYKHFVDLLIK